MKSQPVSEDQRVNVGILGATGVVGQRFVQLLENHPAFRISAIGASERSVDKVYREACRHWKMETPIPSNVAEMRVKHCRSEHFSDCRIIFSALDSSVAGEIEEEFRRADFAVFSNAKNFRMDPLVPLVVPLVNGDHLQLVRHQRKQLGLKRGFIVTNANCSTTGLVMALKPLHDAYGIVQLHVVTMQAISGAGYPGVSALDIVGNVVPFIDGEEEKIQVETKKILGTLSPDGLHIAGADGITVDAVCNRVPVIDGHMECVSIKFANAPPSLDDVERILTSYRCNAQQMDLHHAPKSAIVVHHEQNRPQPRLDLMNGAGFAVTVGRLRSGDYWHLNMTILSHNTILGAAGSGVLNAELALRQNLIEQ